MTAAFGPAATIVAETLATPAPAATAGLAARRAAPLEAGDPVEVGPFTLLGRIGGGGMGVVYLGRSGTDRRVAVKVVRPELADQQQFRTRFAREVKAAASVDCPFTAGVLDADTAARRQWVASEFVDGPTLDDRVDQAGPLPPDQAVALALGLAQALAAIHGRGLSHRDLKPSNIVLAADGPKVIDFGVARAMEASSLTHTGALLGTLAWMAPEQITGEDTGPAADIFAWGLVVAYAALGRHPYGEGRPEVLAMRPLHVAPGLQGLTPALVGAVQRALTVDPAQRPDPQHLIRAVNGPGVTDPAAVIARAWDPAVAGTPIQVPTEAGPEGRLTTPPSPRRRTGARGRGTFLYAIGIAAVILGGIAAAGNSGESPAAGQPAPPAAEQPAPPTTEQALYREILAWESELQRSFEEYEQAVESATRAGTSPAWQEAIRRAASLRAGEPTSPIPGYDALRWELVYSLREAASATDSAASDAAIGRANAAQDEMNDLMSDWRTRVHEWVS